jgi:hypothetical protein
MQIFKINLLTKENKDDSFSNNSNQCLRGGNMASYILRDINDKLYREAKAVCALRGISMRAFLIDRLKMLVKESNQLIKRERKFGLNCGQSEEGKEKNEHRTA